MSVEGFLQELDAADCLRLLHFGAVGRVAVIVDGFPEIVPVNYRVVEDSAGVGLIMRTRPGSGVDQAVEAAFEVDGVDTLHHQGWSVLVRGLLGHLDVKAPARDVDPHPWVGERNAWLVLRPISITGRRLLAPEVEWQFSVRGYL